MVTITLCTRQQKRHWCIDQSMDSVGEGEGGEIWDPWLPIVLGIKPETLALAYISCMAGHYLTLFTSLPPSIHFIHRTSATLVICPSANLGDRLVWAPQRKFGGVHGDTVRAVYWSTISPVKKNWKQMSITTAWQNNDSLFILWTISNRYFISFFRLFSPCGMHS